MSAAVSLILAASPGVAADSAAGRSWVAGTDFSPSDGNIHKLLVERIDRDKQSLGIVVGVLSRKGRRIVSYGRLDPGDTRPLDGNTLFEIGSITKVFTALLLTDMAQRGEVRLDDPIAKYLPRGVKVPERNGRQITLLDLATNTSGLPVMPENFRPKNALNPYVDYTEAKLYSFLSRYELADDIGTRYEYSHVGFGLLGRGLASRAGSDYETLVETRICQPLGMRSTVITLTPALAARLATGHSGDLLKAPPWDYPTLPGAGALRSSANDLLIFLSAMMGLTHSPLAPAMKSMLIITRPTDQPMIDSALAWTVDTRFGDQIIWRNGRTGGHRAFIGFAPGRGIGIVALSNTSYGNFGIDDIGLHLMNARYPLTGNAGSVQNAAASGAAPNR